MCREKSLLNVYLNNCLTQIVKQLWNTAGVCLEFGCCWVFLVVFFLFRFELNHATHGR